MKRDFLKLFLLLGHKTKIFLHSISDLFNIYGRHTERIHCLLNIFAHKYRSGICLRPLSSGPSSMMVRVLKLFFVLICFHFISSHSHIGVVEEDRDANDGIKIDFIYVDQAWLTMVQYRPQVS